MKVLKTSFFSCLVLFLLLGERVQARTVGSNITSSRQLKTFFPASHMDNKMVGFAVFEKGLMLEDSTTTCSYDAFFPISGDIVLNGGTLRLMRDVEIKSPFNLGPGIIDGADAFALEFPGNVSGIDIPALRHTKLLSSFYNDDLDWDIYSVDWSFDDTYLAVAYQSGSIYELEIYYLEDLNLTLTVSASLGSNAFAVRWHPSDYYLAVGEDSGDELETYYLDISDGTLTKKDGVSTSDVKAVAWSPDGMHLAVGRKRNEEILVYDINEGILGSSYSAPYCLSNSINRTVQMNALDWDSTGSYLAVGLDLNNNDAELKVFCFTGTAVYNHSEVEIDSTVYAVAWHPTSSYLAVGKSSDSERLVLYNHDANAATITKVLTTQAGIHRSIYGLSWSRDGNFLAVALDSSSTCLGVCLCFFDSAKLTLNVFSGYGEGSDFSVVAYSHDGNYVATGDKSGKLNAFQLVQTPLVFKDINLFFSSDVTFRSPVIFEGNCLVNGGGNIFNFDENGYIVVAEDSELLIEDASIRGIQANDIVCQNNNSVLALRDIIWQQDSLYTFSVGALKLKNDILMCGDSTFVYASSQTSTLFSKSELELDIGFTFSYDPGVQSQILFELEDETSKLTLNGATLHTTVTGMQLTKGHLRVLRDSFIASELQEVEDEIRYMTIINRGITFGDSSSDLDLHCTIFSGATLFLTDGSLNYKNVLSSSLNFNNLTSSLRVGSGTRLKLYESMDLGRGSLIFEDRAVLAKASGVNVIGSILPLGKLFSASV